MHLYSGEQQRTYFPAPFSAVLWPLQGHIGSGKKPVTVIGIDGRSGGGKTSFANTLAAKLDATLLNTDDFAWWHSMFDWPELLIENALKPLLAGQDVSFRPPAWVERGREGAIVAASNPVIIVEGVGASQEAMRLYLDYNIWVQSDAIVAKERGLIRDAAERPDPAEAERFWNEWQQAEDEFQAAQQSWLQASFTICGTPSALPNPGADAPYDAGQLWLGR